MDQKEINKTLMENSKMIVMFAEKSYGGVKRRTVDLEDFIQESYTIAADLLKRYDNTIGKASTYLYAALPLALKRFKKKNMYSIRIPEHIFAKANEIEKYCKLNKISVYDISVNEVGMILKTTPEVSSMVVKIMTHVPITYPIFEECYSQEEDNSNIDEIIDDKNLYRLAIKEINNLPYRDCNIFKERYIDEKTLIDLSKKYGLSIARIGQINKKSLTRIKGILDKYRSI